MTFYLITNYLYDCHNNERDWASTIGIATTREKAEVLVEEWADSLMSGEDAYKDLEEITSEYTDVKSYKAIDEFEDEWLMDIIIQEVELDKIL